MTPTSLDAGMPRKGVEVGQTVWLSRPVTAIASYDAQQISLNFLMHVTPQICPVVLRHVASELNDRFGESHSVFRGLGFSYHAISTTPSFLVSYRQASVVLRRAMRIASDSGFALSVGRRRSAVSSGLAGLGFLASSNLHDACSLMASHAWAYGCPLHVKTRLGEDDGLVIEVTPKFSDLELEDFWVEEFFCSLTVLARHLLGAWFKPSHLELQAARQSHAPGLRAFMGCDIGFKQEANRLHVETRVANVTPVSADRVVRRYVTEMLDQLKVQPRRSDVCETIRQQLRDHILSPPPLAQLAALLNTSERTLRRRLEEQGTSYQKLLDDVRKDKALDLLRDRSLPISDVSATLGFTDGRNFRRAVKRWTGQAPISIRKDA